MLSHVVRVQGFVWGEHVVSVREGCIRSLDDFPPGTWLRRQLAKAPPEELQIASRVRVTKLKSCDVKYLSICTYLYQNALRSFIRFFLCFS